MLTPSIFGENLFDDWMESPWEDEFFRFPQWMHQMQKAFDEEPKMEKVLYGKHAKNLMKTDVKEKDQAYEVDIDLPGFKKDEVKADLQDGYLTISAEKALNKDNKKEKDTDKYIRRERYSGSMSRSFYIGDAYTKEDVHAKFEDGILRLTFPKKEQKAIETPTRIAIEG